MNNTDRLAALACLEAVELKMAEVYQIYAWRERIGPYAQSSWREQQAKVRSYQHDLQLDGVSGEDNGHATRQE